MNRAGEREAGPPRWTPAIHAWRPAGCPSPPLCWEETWRAALMQLLPPGQLPVGSASGEPWQAPE